MGFAFPKSARLLKRHQFVGALKQGRRLFTKHFIVYVLKSEAEAPRLGVTVSRKVGGAVVRNRIRRLVREAFRTNPGWFRSAKDVVVIAKQPRAGEQADASSLSMQGVAEELGHALRRPPDRHQRGGAPRDRGSAGGSPQAP
ncbi:MAG: ribonuclease P protein component [Myxococcales bacterium]